MSVRRFLFSLLRRSPSPCNMTNDNTLIFVIGATGTGKSKLAIDIASRVKGQVINADALQLYAGLDIVTNKVTTEEQNDVKHHLLGFADPLTPMTVVDFRKRALAIVEDLLSRGITPVVAGGTLYYIESLLWHILVDDVSDSDELVFEEDRKVQQKLTEPDLPLTADNIFRQPILASSFKSIAAPELHKILQQVDPEAANELHPNARRRVIRALQIIQRHRAKCSDILNQQRSQVGGSCYGGSLRYPNAVIFWTQCEESILNERLDDRVDEMVERGLLQELETFYKDYAVRMSEHGLKSDYTQGIFQAIGFKEFHNYLRLPLQERSDKLLRKCIELMKMRTRVYARKQIKWIRNRLIYACDRPVPPIFAVDTTNPDDWNVAVRDRSFRILSHLHEGRELPNDLQPLPRIERPERLRNEKRLMHCEVCDRTFQGTFQYNDHLKSKNHHAMWTEKQSAQVGGDNK